jgi:hypothetical protein
MNIATGARCTGVFLLGAVIALGAASPAPKGRVVNVDARDFALEMPASIPAGLTIFQLKNLGRWGHHVTIVRLDSAHTASEALREIMKDGHGQRPRWIIPVGGPQHAPPGGASNAIVMLEPGNYLAFCEMPGPDATSHYMRGMARGFTVTGPAQPGRAAQGDDTLSLTEYAFTFAHPLTAGVHTIAVMDKGAQLHTVVMVRLPAGVTLDQFLAWANDPRGKQPPAIDAGGVTEISPGATVVFGGRFVPGRYGLLCFTTDAKDGKPHFMHGMAKVITVR